MRRNLQRMMVALAAMMICLGANAIDKLVRQVGMAGEVTSVEALATSTFMLQNGEGDEAVVLYTPSGWDIKVAPLATAIASQDNGGFYKLEALDTHWLIPVYNIDGKTHRETPNWGDTNAYVNAQPDPGTVIFGLAGRNGQHGQDGANLAVWDITYVTGQGFAFHCVGRDVYIGHDGTDARPSTTAVYWKAYTSYGAFVKSEVEATYEVALAAAKATDAKSALETAAAAYANDGDVEAFGDAINAAIDIINACEAINTKYSNLDETAAPLAAAVLEKYNNGEYKNADELIAAYIPVVKAQTTAGADFTGVIVNPEINLATGWTIEKSVNGNGPLLNNISFEYWSYTEGKGGFDYWQEITGLPNGTYTITADMYNDQVAPSGNTFAAAAGVYGTSGTDTQMALVDVQGATFNTYTTPAVTVANGTLRIGVKNANADNTMPARWFVADNFKLTLVEPAAVAPTTYAITVAEGLENGSVEASPAEAAAGETVTLTITPADGYELDELTVMAGETPVTVAEGYTFEMPASAVTVSATFKEIAVEPDPALIKNADFSESTPLDNHLCGYGKDMATNGTTYYGLQDVEGWSKVVVSGDNTTAGYPNSGMGGGVFAYGSNYEMRGGSITAPAAGPDGKEGQALGFFGVWSCGGYYYQEITLPAGEYTLIVPIYNQKGTQANTTQTGFFVNGSDTKYTVAINTTVGAWTTQSVEFTLTEETAGQIRLGYVSTGGGSGANPMIYFDQVKLVSKLEGAIELYDIALEAANEAAQSTIVTGEEKTTLNEAITANSSVDKTSLEAVEAATQALNDAVSAFNTAKPAYQQLADTKALVDVDLWPYASAAKKTAVEEALDVTATSAEDATTKATALLKAYRQFVESNALAEGVEGAVNMTDKIVNPTAEEAIASPWTVVKGQGSGGALDVKNGEPWTDGSDNSTHKYFDGGNWGAQSWDVSLEQEITLEAGKYLLTAIARASGDVAFSLYAGETKVTIPAIGATGGVFNRGWNDQFVEFEVEEGGAIKIGVQGVVQDHQYNWMSFSNFRLVQLEAAPVPATYAIAIAEGITNGSVEASPAEAAAGATVKLTISPDEGYELDELAVMAGENAVSVAEDSTFVMPASAVTVSATFKEAAVAPTTYAITIAEGIENGTVEADVAEAAEGTKVSLTIKADDGYELDEISVKNGEDDVEVAADSTFIMPAGAVLVSVTFKEVAAPEPETPYVTATLVHTAGTGWGSNTGKNTIDGAAEYYNNDTATGWAGAAFAEFDFSNLPNGATITEATLSWKATNNNVNGDRANNVYYLNAEQTVDYEDIVANENAQTFSGNKTFIENVAAPKGTAAIEGTTNVADALKALIAAGQKTIIFQWTGNGGSATLHGKAAEDAPTLVIKYIPGAPELANPSFEADGEKAASNGALAITGWTETIDGSYNNTELRPANSASTTSPYGTSDPSEGDYSLFIRHGWNNNSTTVTLTSDELATIPAGDYTLSVDYKQFYGWDNSPNSNTKVNIALVNGETVLASATSPAAEGAMSGNETYFHDTEWSTLTATLALDEAIPAGAKVVITLDARGQKRSDFFLDNVQFVKIPGVELALLDLEKSLEAATAAKANYTVGDEFFQYAASEIEPLTNAIATAQAAYNAAESKDAVNSAKETLDAFVATFAPVMNTPATDKQYTFQLKVDGETPLYMNLTTEGVTISETATPLSFVSTENAGQFYLAADGELYVGLAGGNAWTMSTAADKKAAWTFSALGEGAYRINNLVTAGRFVGTNAADKEAGKPCYADKQTSNGNVDWIIAEYVAPSTYAITIADGIEGGKVEADVEEAEAGATVTLTITPNEGYELTALSVKAGEDDVEVAEGYTFVMPAAAVTVFATFAEIPEIALNAPTFNVEDGTQAEPNMLPAGSTLKITYTADNLAENGVDADDLMVRMTVLVTGDLPENLMNMQSETKHSVMGETFYIPLGETDFPVALKEGYVYQNIVVMAAALVKQGETPAADEKLAEYAGEPVQLHWVGLEAEEPDAIDAIETAEDVKADGKYMENGKLVIIKNGHKYNASGLRIK